MAQNTRLHSRKVPAQFGFIQIFGDEGGRILDFSEAGLAFESFSPLGTAKTLQFWFSLNLRDRVEGTGEVVWLDSTSKVGGLRFMNLTDRAMRHIRAQYTDSFRSGADHERHRFLAALSKQHSIRVAETTIGKSYDAPSNGAQQASASVGNTLTRDTKIETSPATALDSTDLISLQRHIAACRRQFVLGTVLGLFLASSVALVAFRFWAAGHSPTSAHSNPLSESQSSLSPSTAASNSALQPGTPVPSDAPGRSQPPILNGKYSMETTGTGHSSKSSHSVASVRAIGNETALPANSVDAFSRSTRNNVQKKSATPERLWAAVQAGDTTAAVTLAERYLRGDGVPENCLQARVLLLVASEKKNAEAIKKLSELDKTGCPSSVPN
jgi:hypothetical protein